MSTAACQRRSAGSARGHKVGLLGPCDAFAQLSVAQPLLVTVTVLFADECPRGVAIVDSIAFFNLPEAQFDPAASVPICSNGRIFLTT